jgi:uncharacterized membrane protein
MTARRLRAALAGLALVGLAIAGYLTAVRYGGSTPACVVGHGCEVVQRSRWSELAGVPVALVGLLGYTAILASLALDSERARLATAWLALVGVGFSAYLTYLEVAVIKAICPWCVASAVVMALLAALAVWRVLAAPPAPDEPAGEGRAPTSPARPSPQA